MNISEKKIPNDVLVKIENQFRDSFEHNLVLEFLRKKSKKTLNVGSSQFIRALVVLMDGDINNLEKYSVISDPRDIIALAEKKPMADIIFLLSL